jgi:O-antigen/teichoic acid export membrane protein
VLRLPSLTLWCIVLAALGLPLSVETFVRAFFQARFEVHYAYLLSLPSSLAFVLVAGVILWLGGGLIAIFLAALATGVLSVALMLWIVLPKMQLVWRLDWSLVRSLWRESWELGAVFLIWLIALRIDQLLLYWLRGAAEVGLYAVAVKITEALNLIPESIMVTMFPLLAAAERSAPQRFHRLYRITVRYLVVLVLPLALVVTLEREPLIRLLFGGAYLPASGALVILAWWMFFSYTGAAYVSLMIVRSQQRLLAAVSAVALATNVVLNLLFIPRWGATGAAAATLVSNTLSFLLYCIAPPSRGIMLTCCQATIRPLAAQAVSMVVVGVTAPAALHVVLAPLLYAALLVMLGGIEWQDWVLARRLLRPEPR